jgi:hypothetical protein
MNVRPMQHDTRSELASYLTQLERRLPSAAARAVRWLRQPDMVRFRVPIAVLLILIGIFGVFLPPLGLVPLGLFLIALDVPHLRPPLIDLFGWVDRNWRPNHPAVHRDPQRARVDEAGRTD